MIDVWTGVRFGVRFDVRIDVWIEAGGCLRRDGTAQEPTTAKLIVIFWPLYALIIYASSSVAPLHRPTAAFDKAPVGHKVGKVAYRVAYGSP